MEKNLKTLIATASLLMSANMSWAYPMLQLDASPGGYVYGTTESTITSGNSFTLYALYNATHSSAPSGTFYISAAVTPKVGPTPVNFGSFTVDGTTYSSSVGSSDPGYMQYGGPPVDNTDIFPNLPTHGIYNTFYAEVAFSFDLNNKAKPYDVQTEAGIPVPDVNGGFYYQAFSVDVSNLGAGYNVHFDLYDTEIHNKRSSILFAPFSHDVESSHTSVPDGGMTLVLLGAAMSGLVVIRRKLCC